MTSGTPRPDLPAGTAGIAGTAETTGTAGTGGTAGPGKLTEQAELAELAAGIDEALAPTLAGSDWQVDGPVVTASASWWNHLRCETCGHTFRAGEHVVVCPCGRHPTTCIAAVHRDPAAGVTCWDGWRPDGVLTRCPVSLTPLLDPGLVGETAGP
ncbi:hypothetical protein [Frankia gtarii]|uniref:hypothetical protein n=1 Tax=Frankia gtarii TaxID=2950102 RepID=UPI0021C0DF2D|nr:hypothetical protein [Frankia gtarii]